MSAIGRNDPCPCGSGLKHKKCCLAAPRRRASLPRPSNLPLVRPLARLGPTRTEPFMTLVPSIVWQGQRLRPLYRSITLHDPKQTFHEYLGEIVKLAFGKQWWFRQLGMARPHRHVVADWWQEFGDITARCSDNDHRAPDGSFSGDASGGSSAMIQLGYDLYILQAKNSLPESLMKRLRKQQSFQGARYEVAVAAIMIRSGFEIEFIDDTDKKGKRCEFVASHPTGFKVWVEAKSRVRRGVLHEPGTFGYSEDAEGIRKQIARAREKKRPGEPLLIFVDVNLPGVLPGQRDRPPDAIPWVRDLKNALSKTGAPSELNPDPCAALFVTNFAPYYGWPDGKSYKGEWGMILPDHAEDRMPTELLRVIYDRVGHYDSIPDEI